MIDEDGSSSDSQKETPQVSEVKENLQLKQNTETVGPLKPKSEAPFTASNFSR
jgi:hypothetical protein